MLLRQFVGDLFVEDVFDGDGTNNFSAFFELDAGFLAIGN
jgi:hypothetical protein